MNRILPTVVVSRKMLPLNRAGHMNENKSQKLQGGMVHSWCTSGAQTAQAPEDGSTRGAASRGDR